VSAHSTVAAAVAAMLLVLLSKAEAQTACQAPQESRQVAHLLFGRKIGDRLGVSAAQFGRFVDREISPRFPDGLTVFDTAGVWRDTLRGILVHEPGKVVEIVLPGAADDAERLTAIAEAYKKRFRQQSVGIVISTDCVSF
jgi:hypothetical protein